MKVKLMAKRPVDIPLESKWFHVEEGQILDGTLVSGLVCFVVDDPDEGKTYQIFRRTNVEENFFIEE